MLSVLQGDTASMGYYQIPLRRRATGRDVVVEAGPFVVLSLSGPAVLDSRWVSLARMTCLRGGS